MLGTIRKHQVWLWWIIGGITVISFVIFGPMNVNRSGRGSNDGGPDEIIEIQGWKVSRDEYINMMREISLDHLLNGRGGERMDSPAVRQEALQRLLLVKKQRDMGINVTTEAAAMYAKLHLMQPLASAFGVSSLEEFLDKILKPNGLGDADFERFLRHKLGNDQLISVAGASGRMVTPGEAESIYRAEHEPRASSMLFFSVSNYMSSVVTTPEVLQDFYSNHVATYKIAERVQVEYVKFNVTNFFGAAEKSYTNLDLQVEQNAARPGISNMFPTAKTPAELKVKVRETMIREKALDDAHKAAAEFALDLDKITTNRTLATFEAMASKKELTPQMAMPFDEIEGPTNLDVGPDFTTIAFSLTNDSPFSRSIRAADGYYVLAFKGRMAPEIPSYKDVEAKVTQDYREAQARELTQAAVAKFYMNLTNGVAQGKSFSNICAEAKMMPETLSPFSISSTNVPPEVKDRISLPVLRNALFETRVGKVSRPYGTRDGAFMLSVDKVLPVDEAEMKKELPGYLANIRRGRMYDSFNQWLNIEIRSDPGFAMALQKVSDEAEGRVPQR